MMATAYAKNYSRHPAVVQPISGQLASPGEPLREVAPSIGQADLLAAGRLQANYLNLQVGRKVAGTSIDRVSSGGTGGGERSRRALKRSFMGSFE